MIIFGKVDIFDVFFRKFTITQSNLKIFQRFCAHFEGV
jgi:hypothetical protein